jgi:type IV pilus assembly protein PilC
MAKFTYKATNSSGNQINGSLEAVNRDAALSSLNKQGLKLLSLDFESGANTKKKGFSLKSTKVKSVDLVIFTRQLSTMVGAGVPLLRALTTLQEQSESPALRDVLGVVVKDVQGGTALGDALGKHPDAFSDVYVNMVRAGEAAGILDTILKRLAVQQEKNNTMKKKIKSAMSYPTVLMGITVLAFFGLMLFVVPQIGKIIKDLGGPNAKLPPLTEAMLAMSDFMIQRWYIMIVGIVLTVVLLRRYIKTPSGKEKFHGIILKTPAVGLIVRKVAVARFARTFASLMGAGVSVLEALRVTGSAIGNKVYEKELARAAEEVRNGKQLSQALSGSKLFPGIIPQMLSVGEETGQTDVVLIKVADFYEEEVDTMIDGISSIIEPVMIVVMGSMVGLIAASVMGPISSLSQNIQG